MNTKYDCFEIMLDRFFEKEDANISNFTILKALKLLFFVSAVSAELSRERTLLDTFNRFVAMPYGPVESDIYNKVLAAELKKYVLTAQGCCVKEHPEQLEVDGTVSVLINDSIDKLLERNYNIAKYSAFQLVDLSHKWSCWQICFGVAQKQNKASIAIPSNLINESTKYYSL